MGIAFKIDQLDYISTSWGIYDQQCPSKLSNFLIKYWIAINSVTIGVKLVGKHSCDFWSLVLANSNIGVYFMMSFYLCCIGRSSLKIDCVWITNQSWEIK